MMNVWCADKAAKNRNWRKVFIGSKAIILRYRLNSWSADEADIQLGEL